MDTARDETDEIRDLDDGQLLLALDDMDRMPAPADGGEFDASTGAKEVSAQDDAEGIRVRPDAGETDALADMDERLADGDDALTTTPSTELGDLSAIDLTDYIGTPDSRFDTPHGPSRGMVAILALVLLSGGIYGVAQLTDGWPVSFSRTVVAAPPSTIVDTRPVAASSEIEPETTASIPDVPMAKPIDRTRTVEAPVPAAPAAVDTPPVAEPAASADGEPETTASIPDVPMAKPIDRTRTVEAPVPAAPAAVDTQPVAEPAASADGEPETTASIPDVPMAKSIDRTRTVEAPLPAAPAVEPAAQRAEPAAAAVVPMPRPRPAEADRLAGVERREIILGAPPAPLGPPLRIPATIVQPPIQGAPAPEQRTGAAPDSFGQPGEPRSFTDVKREQPVLQPLADGVKAVTDFGNSVGATGSRVVSDATNTVTSWFK